MSNTETRLVNASVLFEVSTDFGTTYLVTGNGADGIPERALNRARQYATLDTNDGSRVVGIAITDVRTGERWAVTI
jgi:hypothetical protein